MISTLTFLSAVILLFLSLLHWYWAFGGNWGVEYTIPDQFKADFFDPNNKVRTVAATIVVALGLLAFAIIVASNYRSLLPFLTERWIVILTRLIGGIFLLRVIGDGNMFGLFKKKSDSLFAQKDSQLFIPLCLYLGASCFLMAGLG